MEGLKNGRTERRTDILKFPPVFDRTLALWGRCPKREEKHNKTAKAEEEEQEERERKEGSSDTLLASDKLVSAQ